MVQLVWDDIRYSKYQVMMNVMAAKSTVFYLSNFGVNRVTAGGGAGPLAALVGFLFISAP